MNASDIGVIFDCDGTLIDSMDAWSELETDLARRAGVVLTKVDTDKLATLSIPECALLFHERFGLADSGKAVEDIMSRFMLEFYGTRAKACKGALAFVQSLKERGIRMSVASSSPQAYLREGLSHCGFDSCFDAVVSVDDVGMSKRYPNVWHRAREAMGTVLTLTWGVEDSAYALRTLQQAGYRTLGICNTETSESYWEFARYADRVFAGFDDIDADTFLAWNFDTVEML